MKTATEIGSKVSEWPVELRAAHIVKAVALEHLAKHDRKIAARRGVITRKVNEGRVTNWDQLLLIELLKDKKLIVEVVERASHAIADVIVTA